METAIHELAAGYALDALDATERDAFEAHLADCDQCRAEVASFGEIAAALAIGAAGPEPRAELRDRILAAVAAEEQNVIPLAERRRGLVPALAAGAAVAAAAAAALAVWATSLAGQLDETRSALAIKRQVEAVLTDPAARTVALQAGEGRVVLRGDRTAVLVIERLAPITQGRTYEAWVIEDGVPSAAGLFDGSGGRAVIPIELPVPPRAVVAVTIEKAGGAAVPTGEPLIASVPA
jgi:anti-sigma-K factor RskA